MFTDRYPNFHRGRILKTEMLESLRDYPRSLAGLLWTEYSDGIVVGAEIRTDGDVLVVSRGIVKWGDRLYTLEEDIRVPYEANGRETAVKLRFHEPVTRSDIVYCETQIVADPDVAIRRDELELARFKLKEGARLRLDYTSFEDMTTEYNTLNLIHRQHIGRKRHTLSPAVTRYFATELLKSGTTDPYDVSFAMQCLNGSTVDRELIELYAANRLRSDRKPYDNAQLHRMLGRILDEAGAGVRTRPDMRLGGARRVLVD
ncbi:DNA and RNA helicase [Paenibacillus sp. MMS18-CY102]|uniref:DNA and RNA helicase n=1 Tax=Paenibacillus sp. MMS18-CY102 TaxID=2682849 RepID=UPI0013665581|nr:DNA and RNA helicase [Paenibacillus sp. MMS18-CY102]MWC31388.1 DNA and RNA helicase [Paenibacillus sp. MMS18-CY102]